MYKVIQYFTDLQDDNHPYNVGDDYPREGLKVTKERIEELSSDRNKRKKPLIELATSQGTKEEPKAEPKEKPQEEVEKDDRSGSSKNAKSKPRKKK